MILCVLNLVINGLPSILLTGDCLKYSKCSFKPCYKWITFNTLIPLKFGGTPAFTCFKPCYKWITFNTL